MSSSDGIHIVDAIAKLDLKRADRSGAPEVVFGEGKSLDQLIAITQALLSTTKRAIVSRIRGERLEQLAAALERRLGNDLVVRRVENGQVACFAMADHIIAPSGGAISVLCAGTSDIPIAEEAEVMAREMGCRVRSHYDVGVAGLQRLSGPLQDLAADSPDAIVVVAGMEGALATVIKGLVPHPVIGVPTSVGYGFGRPGEAALLSMLSTCALGLTVVNIDNGLGGGCAAALIANRAARYRENAKESK